MDFDPKRHNLVEYPVDSLKDQIQQIYDGLIARVAPRLEKYAQDPRRADGHGSVYLHFGDGAGYFSSDGKSKFSIRVCDKVSTVKAVVGLNRTGLLTSPFEEAGFSLDDLVKLHEKGYEFGVHLKLVVAHQLFPQGHTWNGISVGEMWGADDYNPSQWGHRHDVGYGFKFFVRAPGVEQADVYEQKVLLRARFDRDPVRIVTWEETNPESEQRWPSSTTPQSTREATEEDVEALSQCVVTLKDLRPLVADPNKIHAERAMYAELFGRIFGESEAPTRDVVPSL